MEPSSEFMDMVLSGETPEAISDKIKEILFSKSSGIIDELKPYVAQSMFTQGEEE